MLSICEKNKVKIKKKHSKTYTFQHNLHQATQMSAANASRQPGDALVVLAPAEQEDLACSRQARATRAGWSQEASRHKGGCRSKCHQERPPSKARHKGSKTTDGPLGGAPFAALYATQNVVTDAALNATEELPCNSGRACR